MGSKSESPALASKPASSDRRRRFEEVAREIGADESDDALDRAMGKLDLKAKPKPPPDEQVGPGAAR